MSSMQPWRLLIHKDLPGTRQMAIDESLLQHAIPHSQPVLRLYTWKRPTLSLGYFQDYKRVVSEPFCVHNNIDVVRRLTGGRSVLHHHEITYAVVASSVSGCFENKTLQETYRLIAQALNCGLDILGVQQAMISMASNPVNSKTGLPQCFVSVSKYELASDTRKIIGSAQKRDRDRFLQHGSILLDFDDGLQQGCVAKPDPAIREKIAPLNTLLNRSLGVDEVIGVFTEAFKSSFAIAFHGSELTEEERVASENLEHKYNSDEWTQLKRCR